MLKLATQKLCMHLGKPVKNINGDIKGLVAKRLYKRVPMALDTVRSVANEAVHPGYVDLKGDHDTSVDRWRASSDDFENRQTTPRVSFAAQVALAPRNTRFRLVANLCRTGLLPAGSDQECSVNSYFT